MSVQIPRPSSHGWLIHIQGFSHWIGTHLEIQKDPILSSSTEIPLLRPFLQTRPHLWHTPWGILPFCVPQALLLPLCPLFAAGTLRSQEPTSGAMHHKGSGKLHFSAPQPGWQARVLSMLGEASHPTVGATRAGRRDSAANTFLTVLARRDTTPWVRSPFVQHPPPNGGSDLAEM